MWKWSWGRITAFVWLFFVGVLLRVIFLEAWKMETMEARYAMIAAGASLVCAILLSIAYGVSRTLREHTKQIQKEEVEKAAIAKKEAEKEAKRELKIKGFNVLPIVKWLFIGGFLGLLYVFSPFSWFGPTQEAPPKMYSEFVGDVESGKVGKAITTSLPNETMKIRVTTTDGYRYLTIAPAGANVTSLLRQYKVPFTEDPEKQSHWFTGVLLGWVPMLLFVGIWIFFMRKVSGGGTGSNISSFLGKSRHRNVENSSVTFADVAGEDEPKEELQEVIEFLKNPKKFHALSAKIPKGLLLVGPPGCGKTLLAKAVAGEAKVPFFSVSGSDFVEMFVGVGASRVRDLFEQAIKKAPCIIFIDEIDAVGRHRGAGIGGGNDEREQTLNQLLVAMDGFESNMGVIVIAATNRPDILDPALLRPGRFDRRVIVDNPDSRGRREILAVHLRGIPLASDVNVEALAKQTPGFSGADLASVVNEGALLAARLDKKLVGMDEFTEAVERVIGGLSRRSKTLTPKEREMVAHHEAGHALLRKLLPHADPPHKVTIVSRGMALGYVIGAPPEDRYMRTKPELLDEICVAMGGRVAEELIFDTITTGAANDFEQATDIAHRMVTSFGMSEKLGRVTLGKRNGPIFLGRDLVESRNYSEDIAREIDREVRCIIDDAYARARQTIEANRDKLERLARALLERETLNAEELDLIINQVRG